MRDFNATQASIRAGYSQKTARAIGSENLTKPIIQEAIKSRMAEKGMTADEVLTRLTQMARGDMGDFMDISSMSFQLDLNGAKEKGLTHLIKKVKQRTITHVEKDGTEEETNTIEIELYDAQNALVQLGRYHTLFTDKSEITGKDGKPIEFGVIPVDYRTAITALAPRPMDDSESPCESEDTFNGEAVG